MDECKVSVIVGIYNSGDYLRDGLESLAKQTWKNIEVIMIDDGSTDISAYICDEYAERDQRFIAIHKVNSGVCDSRNQGLRIATGDYVCFMDGDDWVCDDYVEYLMHLILSTNTKMALSDKVFTSVDRTQIKKDSIEIWNVERAISNIIYPYMTYGPWNKIYSMDVIRNNNITFPNHWFGETMHFASDVAYYSGEVSVGHRKIYNYRTNNTNSGTSRFSVESRLLSIDNCTKLREKEFYDNPRIKRAIEWHIYDNHFVLIVNIIGSGLLNEYKNEFLNAQKYLKHNWIGVLWNSEVNIKRRIKIIIEAFFPVILANMMVIKKQSGLNFNERI